MSMPAPPATSPLLRAGQRHPTTEDARPAALNIRPHPTLDTRVHAAPDAHASPRHGVPAGAVPSEAAPQATHDVVIRASVISVDDDFVDLLSPPPPSSPPRSPSRPVATHDLTSSQSRASPAVAPRVTHPAVPPPAGSPVVVHDLAARPGPAVTGRGIASCAAPAMVTTSPHCTPSPPRVASQAARAPSQPLRPSQPGLASPARPMLLSPARPLLSPARPLGVAGPSPAAPSTPSFASFAVDIEALLADSDGDGDDGMHAAGDAHGPAAPAAPAAVGAVHANTPSTPVAAPPPLSVPRTGQSLTSPPLSLSRKRVHVSSPAVAVAGSIARTSTGAVVAGMAADGPSPAHRTPPVATPLSDESPMFAKRPRNTRVLLSQDDAVPAQSVSHATPRHATPGHGAALHHATPGVSDESTPVLQMGRRRNVVLR